MSANVQSPDTGDVSPSQGEVLKQAEKRAYARGYAAGRKQRSLDWERRRDRQRRQIFGFALIGTLCAPRGWVQGIKQITSIEDYVSTAIEITNAAMRKL